MYIQIVTFTSAEAEKTAQNRLSQPNRQERVESIVDVVTCQGKTPRL